MDYLIGPALIDVDPAALLPRTFWCSIHKSAHLVLLPLENRYFGLEADVLLRQLIHALL